MIEKFVKISQTSHEHEASDKIKDMLHANYTENPWLHIWNVWEIYKKEVKIQLFEIIIDKVTKLLTQNYENMIEFENENL